MSQPRKVWPISAQWPQKANTHKHTAQVVQTWQKPIDRYENV